jgi:hypothetical protein
MASPKIKKKSTNTKASILPRQGAIPCLVLLLIALAVIGFFVFASLHTAS